VISIVIPSFNESQVLPVLHQRLTDAARAFSQDYEILVVDDGSSDDSLEVCRRLCSADARFKVLSLTRNFGHQAALTCGLDHARGDVVAVLDADLQDPPEELVHFLAKLDEGWDVVYAIRTKRKEGPLKRVTYHAYYRLLRALAALEIPLDAGDFCVMRARVVEAMRALPERGRFVRGLRTWVGFRQVGLAYERQARFAGPPKYTFSRLVKLGLDGIVSFSYRPLQLAVVVGSLVGAGAIVLAAVVFAQYVFDWTIAGYNPRQARGWTSLMIVMLFTAAVQLCCLGIIGEYLGRLFEEVKGRPAYLVRERLNLPPVAVSHPRE